MGGQGSASLADIPRFWPEEMLPESVMALQPRERYIVASVIWNQKSLHAIAKEMNLSVRHVRRLRDRGFAQLKLVLNTNA